MNTIKELQEKQKHLKELVEYFENKEHLSLGFSLKELKNELSDINKLLGSVYDV